MHTIRLNRAKYDHHFQVNCNSQTQPFLSELLFDHCYLSKIRNQECFLLVYDRNLVLVSAIETTIKFWYRYWCLNFCYLNRNFLHILFLKFFSRFSALFWIFPRLYTGIMKLVWKFSKKKLENAKLVTNDMKIFADPTL